MKHLLKKLATTAMLAACLATAVPDARADKTVYFYDTGKNNQVYLYAFNSGVNDYDSNWGSSDNKAMTKVLTTNDYILWKLDVRGNANGIFMNNIKSDDDYKLTGDCTLSDGGWYYNKGKDNTIENGYTYINGYGYTNHNNWDKDNTKDNKLKVDETTGLLYFDLSGTDGYYFRFWDGPNGKSQNPPSNNNIQISDNGTYKFGSEISLNSSDDKSGEFQILNPGSGTYKVCVNPIKKTLVVEKPAKTISGVYLRGAVNGSEDWTTGIKLTDKGNNTYESESYSFTHGDKINFAVKYNASYADAVYGSAPTGAHFTKDGDKFAFDYNASGKFTVTVNSDLEISSVVFSGTETPPTVTSVNMIGHLTSSDWGGTVNLNPAENGHYTGAVQVYEEKDNKGWFYFQVHDSYGGISNYGHTSGGVGANSNGTTSNSLSASDKAYSLAPGTYVFDVTMDDIKAKSFTVKEAPKTVDGVYLRGTVAGGNADWKGKALTQQANGTYKTATYTFRPEEEFKFAVKYNVGDDKYQEVNPTGTGISFTSQNDNYVFAHPMEGYFIVTLNSNKEISKVEFFGKPVDLVYLRGKVADKDYGWDNGGIVLTKTGENTYATDEYTFLSGQYFRFLNMYNGSKNWSSSNLTYAGATYDTSGDNYAFKNKSKGYFEVTVANHQITSVEFVGEEVYELGVVGYLNSDGKWEGFTKLSLQNNGHYTGKIQTYNAKDGDSSWIKIQKKTGDNSYVEYGPKTNGSKANLDGASANNLIEKTGVDGFGVPAGTYFIDVTMKEGVPASFTIIKALETGEGNFYVCGDINDWGLYEWKKNEAGKYEGDLAPQKLNPWKLQRSDKDPNGNASDGYWFKLEVDEFYGQFKIMEGNWDNNGWSYDFTETDRDNDKVGTKDYDPEGTYWSKGIVAGADKIKVVTKKPRNMHLKNNAIRDAVIWFHKKVGESDAELKIDGEGEDYYIFFAEEGVVDKDGSMHAKINTDMPNTYNYVLPEGNDYIYVGKKEYEANWNGQKTEYVTKATIDGLANNTYSGGAIKGITDLDKVAWKEVQAKFATNNADGAYIVRIPAGFENPAGTIPFTVSLTLDGDVKGKTYQAAIRNGNVYFFSGARIHVRPDEDVFGTNVKVYYRVYDWDSDYKLKYLDFSHVGKTENDEGYHDQNEVKWVAFPNQNNFEAEANKKCGWVEMQSGVNSKEFNHMVREKDWHAHVHYTDAEKTKKEVHQIPVEHANAMVQYKFEVGDPTYTVSAYRALAQRANTIGDGTYLVPMTLDFDFDNARDEKVKDQVKYTKLNGTDIYFEPGIETGVEEIEVEEAAEEMEDAEGPVVYYNLQGLRVENPEEGIYIKVTGKKSEKVVLKK